VYQEPGIFADLDDSNMESGLIVDRDRQTYGEIVYLLLKDVQTDTGLKIHYDYRFYDPGWANETGFVARDARRGTVRMFLDPWVLTYVGYHPVSNVTYTFTDSSGQTKMFTVYVEEDGARAQEIWKAPKKSSGRLILSDGYRSGDSLPTQIIEDYMAFEKRNTFQYGVNELGLVVLTKEYTTDQTPDHAIELMEGTSRYTFAAHSAKTYTYDGKQTKPSTVYTFDFGAEGDPKPQAVRNFLWRQLLNPPSDIQQYATIHKYTYDHFGFVTEETDERGNVTTYRYDGPYHQISYSKTTSENQANILETTYSYNADGTLSRMEERYTYKDPSKPDVQKTDTVITEYLAYNAFKRPTRIRLTASGTQFGYWLSQEIRYEYSADGLHVTKETAYVKLHKDEQPTALVTEYEYDARGRLIKQTNPDGSAVEYAYDWKNRQIAETFVPADGSASRTTSITYVDAQRKVTVELPDGEQRIYYYSAFGDLEKEIQQIGGNSRTLTENRYNPSGRVLTETLPFGREDRKTQFVYGTNGELWRVMDALNQETVYQYASAVHDTGGTFTYLQKTTRQVDPDGKETWTYEDRFGRVEKVVEKTPTKTRTTYYTYDPLGRVKQQTVQAGNETQTTTYGYDAAGNLIYLRDELGNVYTYAYNSLGQLTAVHINGKLQRSKTYNENGWLLSSSNAEGQTESYRYNAVGLVSEFTDKGGQIHRYTYTPYRELARLSVTKAGSEVYWKDHAYDPDTRLLTGISNSEGEDIAYAYDNWKRLSGQTVAGRTYTFEYDAQDQLSALVYPDGQKVTYTYDPLFRIKTVSYPGMGTVSYTYEVGANVNRYTIDYPNNVSQVRQTDAFDELVSVTHRRNGSAYRTETYGYDGFGNIISMTTNGISYNFSYDGLNRIIRETGPSGQTSYRYDDRGNRVSRVTDQLTVPVEGTREYTYNALNQLKTFADSEGIQASYTYYGDGLRAIKRVNGNLTRYVYFNGYVIEELGESGNVKARNIWGNELLYRRDFTSGKGGYYLYNGHGDVVAIKNSTGNNLNVYEYDIWGNIVSQTEGMSNPFKYAGEIYDEETGYYYLRARYYDPAIGRFISEDTYEGEVTNPLSLNLYTYVQNNPLLYIDPTGHKVWLIHGTFSDSSTWTLDIRTYISELFNEPVEPLDWSGDNTKKARREGAEELAAKIYEWHLKNPGEPIRLVGHSHGGNVAILVTNKLAEMGMEVETLITIATPVRGYKLETEAGQHIHVYNNKDMVQIAGGYDFGKSDAWKVWRVVAGSRKFKNAINVRAKDAEKYNPINAHSAMHSNVEIWKKYIEPIIEMK